MKKLLILFIVGIALSILPSESHAQYRQKARSFKPSKEIQVGIKKAKPVATWYKVTAGKFKRLIKTHLVVIEMPGRSSKSKKIRLQLNGRWYKIDGREVLVEAHGSGPEPTPQSVTTTTVTSNDQFQVVTTTTVFESGKVVTTNTKTDMNSGEQTTTTITTDENGNTTVESDGGGDGGGGSENNGGGSGSSSGGGTGSGS